MKHYISVRHAHMKTVAAYTLILFVSALVAGGQSVVINEFRNGTYDEVELVVVADKLDMRGYILKDYSSAAQNDNGGKYLFSSNALWSSVSAGSMLVISNSPWPSDPQISADGFIVWSNLRDTNLFTSVGFSFDIASDELVQIKAAGAAASGSAGAIHSLATYFASLNTQFVAAPFPKLASTNGNTSFGESIEALSSTSQLSDFNGTDAIADRTNGSIAQANSPGNQSWIQTLRQGSQAQQPRMVVEPTPAIAISGSSVTFKSLAAGTPPLSYQWMRNGTIIPGETNPVLTLNNPQWNDIDFRYSVKVNNNWGYAVSKSASLAFIGQCSLGTPATPVTDPADIVQEPGKNNLVIVTHGWLWARAPTPYPWLTDMTTAIAARVPSDWQVVALDWSSDAYTVGTDWLPDVESIESSQWLPADKSYDRAKNIGSRLGKKLAAQNWQHIHFIAHSAGSALIQQATDVIKSTPSGIEIHETFLDPYPRTDKKGITWFGSNADWADCYWTANDMITGKFTDGPLTHAHNVEVSWLDPAKNIISHSRYNYPQLDYVTRVQIAHSSHGWPYGFYSNSVNETSPSCAGEYGFNLSKEAGGWADRINYPINNGVAAICGNVPEVEYKPLIQQIEPVNFSQFINPIVQPFAQSLSGVNMGVGAFTLSSDGGQSPFQNKSSASLHDASSSTGTTAWLTVGLTVTSLVNYVQFDAGFNGTNGGLSLLSVYWNTNLIGSVDESVEAPGIHPYHFSLPGSYTNGIYSLGFELDSFTDTASSITITNIVLGFQGVDVPITLESMRIASNNFPAVMLAGASNYIYMIDASSNLVDWSPAVEFQNTNATTTIIDIDGTNFNHRYYRGRFQ